MTQTFPNRKLDSSDEQPPVEVDSWDEVYECFRSKSLSVAVDAGGDSLIGNGVLNALDGEEHVRRRRAIGQL